MSWFKHIRAKAVSDMMADRQNMTLQITGSETSEEFFLLDCERRFDATFMFAAQQWAERRVLNKEDDRNQEAVAMLSSLEVEVTISLFKGIGVSEAVATELAHSFVE